MKTMISLDMSTIAKYVKQELVLIIPLALILPFAIGNANVIPAAFTPMIPMVLSFTLFALDEQKGWESFRLALPLSRRGVVFGRYGMGALMTLAGLVFGALVATASTAIACLIPALPNAGSIAANIEPVESACILLASTACAILILAATQPLIFKAGMTNGMRFMPLLLVLVMVVAGVALESSGAWIDVVAPVIDSIFSLPTTSLLTMLGLVVAAFAIYCASALIACRLYEKREL